MSPYDGELKTPPYSLQAEQSVIGGLLLDNAAWAKVSRALQEGDFYLKTHRYLFRAIFRLLSDNSPADILTVCDFLEAKGLLDEVGGLPYVATLAKDTPSVANIASYAAIVRDRAVLRQLIQAGTLMVSSGFNPDGKDTAVLIAAAESAVFALGRQQGRDKQGFERLGDVLRSVIDTMEDNFYHAPDSGVLGVSTGFAELDKLISGFQGGDLVIVAGRPSMGKSALVMNFAESAALAGKPVAVFSLEMSAAQLGQRMLAGSSHLPLRVIRESWQMRGDQWPLVSDGLARIGTLPLFIDDCGDQSATAIRSACMRLATDIRHEFPAGIGMVVVDYLQLMAIDGGRNASRNDVISQITRQFKQLAKEFDVPVLVLSQLNRDVDKRPNKRPLMPDLRDSGGIEQDADLIVFVYRDEKYNEDSPDKGIAEIIVAKQRNGPLGTVRLGFDGWMARFRGL